ncbi:P-loop containing nucleoside triphosphate hydrolase protein [Whalleya microplaca]|nr:P-loop containing nucleoside triphosphate hydrolase protein [Whalleya microplaca]
MFKLNLNSWVCHLLEYVYSLPEPPSRKRTKPMEVLCVGLPRSGTESLQHALIKLGYDYTFHGWDIVLEEPNYCQQWVRLSRKKWFGPLTGENNITAADFDALLGHSVAITDTAGSVFAAELIAAYPDAKVILNYRKDIDAWHNSLVNTIARADSHWLLFLLSCLGRECFWAWHSHIRFMYPGLFRALDGNIKTGIARNGKWVYREHCNIIRGLVPKERLLEWTVEDGWEPLCEFLGKPLPDEPFPHANAAAGWSGQESKVAQRFLFGAAKTVMLLGAIIVGAAAIWHKY